jgi:hypothetical protein
MQTRRIVTGHDGAGKAVVLSDGPAPEYKRFTHVPGLEATLVWQTAGTEAADRSVAATTWLPGPQETALLVITFPPDAVMKSGSFDPMAAGMEYVQNMPGLAECFEPDNPGMHRTATIDYAILLSGEIVLELDDGRTTALRVGDVVVQQATRHAWRNPSAQPATLAFAMGGLAAAARAANS